MAKTRNLDGTTSYGSPDLRLQRRRMMWRVDTDPSKRLAHLVHPLAKNAAAYCGEPTVGVWAPGAARGRIRCMKCLRWLSARTVNDTVEDGTWHGRVVQRMWKMRPPKPPGDGWVYVVGKWRQRRKRKEWYE